MVRYNDLFEEYRDVNPLQSEWEKDWIYVLCDAKDITSTIGMLNRDGDA